MPAPLLPMFLSLETLAALATIVGTGVSILALIESRAWITLTSVLVVILALAAVLYARRQRLERQAASNVIEGHSIDSLNASNLRRRLDRNFLVQVAEHTVRIEGPDMRVSWKYTGYSRVEEASSFEFSIDAGPGTSFEDLDCTAFDIGHDPEMSRIIRPMLIGPEGISKKVAVPFLEPLSRNQPFGVLLKCTLPDCLTPGTAYYSSTLSFDQKRVRRCTVRMEFVGPAPSWVRVYECVPGREPKLLKSLSPSRHMDGFCEYIDVRENINGRSAHVYLFCRDFA